MSFSHRSNARTRLVKKNQAHIKTPQHTIDHDMSSTADQMKNKVVHWFSKLSVDERQQLLTIREASWVLTVTELVKIVRHKQRADVRFSFTEDASVSHAQGKRGKAPHNRGEKVHVSEHHGSLHLHSSGASKLQRENPARHENIGNTSLSEAKTMHTNTGSDQRGQTNGVVAKSLNGDHEQTRLDSDLQARAMRTETRHVGNMASAIAEPALAAARSTQETRTAAAQPSKMPSLNGGGGHISASNEAHAHVPSEADKCLERERKRALIAQQVARYRAEACAKSESQACAHAEAPGTTQRSRHQSDVQKAQASHGTKTDADRGMSNGLQQSLQRELVNAGGRADVVSGLLAKIRAAQEKGAATTQREEAVREKAATRGTESAANAQIEAMHLRNEARGGQSDESMPSAGEARSGADAARGPLRLSARDGQTPDKARSGEYARKSGADVPEAREFVVVDALKVRMWMLVCAP